MAGCVDDDIVSGHHPGDVYGLADVTNTHVQVWWDGSVHRAQELVLVSYERRHFVSPVKRQTQDAPATIAGCAKKEDLHDRTSGWVVPSATVASRGRVHTGRAYHVP
jgi:hypothetical protein